MIDVSVAVSQKGSLKFGYVSYNGKEELGIGLRLPGEDEISTPTLLVDPQDFVDELVSALGYEKVMELVQRKTHED